MFKGLWSTFAPAGRTTILSPWESQALALLLGPWGMVQLLYPWLSLSLSLGQPAKMAEGYDADTIEA